MCKTNLITAPEYKFHFFLTSVTICNLKNYEICDLFCCGFELTHTCINPIELHSRQSVNKRLIKQLVLVEYSLHIISIW